MNDLDLPPELVKRVKFSPIGLAGTEEQMKNKSYKTLKQIMDENGHKWIDWLKVRNN